jgi:hypothetical protein
MNRNKTRKEQHYGKQKQYRTVKEIWKEQKIDLSVYAGIKGCKWF